MDLVCERMYFAQNESDPRRRVNANRGPDHMEALLLMADENPTDRGFVATAADKTDQRNVIARKSNG